MGVQEQQLLWAAAGRTLYVAKVQNFSGHSASASSTTLRAATMVSRRSTRASVALAAVSSALCRPWRPSSTDLAAVLTPSSGSSAFLSDGMTCWLIISIMACASHSTVPA